jgi:hypothetical protein
MPKKQAVVNTTARGYCVIPHENVKQYEKVTRRLRKDGIEFEEEFVDNQSWMAMSKPTLVKGIMTILLNPTSGPCIVLTYGK